MTPTPKEDLAQAITLPHQLAAWFSGLVSLTHKEFAALWGILATTGVVGVAGGTKTGYALLAYSAVVHAAEKLFAKA